MLEKQKERLSNNDTLYILVKCMKNLHNQDFCNLLRSFFQAKYEGCLYWLEHPGTRFPEKTVYNISVGEEFKETIGFCAQMHHILYKLMFADECHLLPRVVWGKCSPYYEPEMKTNNVFEYYFEPVSEASKYDCNEFKNLIRSNIKHILKYQNMVNGSYAPDDKNLKMLAESFQKHIRLNETTKKYISEGIRSIFKSNEKILGIHARGGDFKLEHKNHPHHVSAEVYLEMAKREFDSGKYEKVFIATDDEGILETFINRFGDRLIFYDDVPRVSGNKSIHLQTLNRPMHHYKLGLELLRDVYTLVSCESFICGLSHVSFMVRYVKEASGKAFQKTIVLDKGIN